MKEFNIKTKVNISANTNKINDVSDLKEIEIYEYNKKITKHNGEIIKVIKKGYFTLPLEESTDIMTLRQKSYTEFKDEFVLENILAQKLGIKRVTWAGDYESRLSIDKNGDVTLYLKDNVKILTLLKHHSWLIVEIDSLEYYDSEKTGIFDNEIYISLSRKQKLLKGK